MLQEIKNVIVEGFITTFQAVIIAQLVQVASTVHPCAQTHTSREHLHTFSDCWKQEVIHFTGVEAERQTEGD